LRIKPPPSKGKGVQRSPLERRFNECAVSNEGLRSLPVGYSWRISQAAQLHVGEASVNTQARAVDFLEANLFAKSALVENLANCWALASSGSTEPPKVTEE